MKPQLKIYSEYTFLLLFYPPLLVFYYNFVLTEKNGYSGSISKYSVVISEIFILTYFNISDSEAEYLDITIEYMRWLLHS